MGPNYPSSEETGLSFSMVFQMVKLVFIVVINVFLIVAADSFKEESMERAVRNGRARVVFTPIRGKRLYPDTRDSLLRMLEAADALNYYYDQLPYDAQADEPDTKVTKKVIFTPKLGRNAEDLYEAKRGYEADFTPRLGRQADGVTSPDEVYRQDGGQADGRSKYFSPRLGRTVELTPRLGRSFDYEMFPSKVRLTRSTNKTTNT